MDRIARLRALSALVATTSLVACGGGGGSDDPPVASPPPAPATVAITGKAVDGALQGAKACYDVNGNGACDSGEPTATTAADGSYSLAVSTGNAGLRRVVVEVPAGAIDAETGPVAKPFVLISPATGTAAAHAVFVSPLTTLVVQQMDAGQSKDEAVAFVQGGLGLAISPLADFIAANDTKAANAAKLVMATQGSQATALAGALSQTDLSGATVTQANLDTLVAKAVAGALPMIGGSAAATPLSASEVTALAANVVAQIALTAPEAVTAIGVAKLPPEPASTASPTEGASLAALRFTNANDWSIRAFQSTVADNTPDAAGLTRSYDVRTRTDAYAYAGGSPAVISWVLNNDSARAGDRYWNGSTWRTCDIGTRTTGTPRDATGRNSYNYCDGLEHGTTVRSAVDISGQTLSSVLTTKIRTLAGGASGMNFADWGPADLGLLGTATFPTGSRLHYQTGTPLQTAFAYDVRETNVVTVASQAAADGGDARVNASLECNQSSVPFLPATNLEQMVARTPGKPCVFNPATNADGTSGPTNEAWGISSQSIGNVANYFTTLPGTGTYFTSVGRMRVSFTGTGNGVVYHQCYERRTPLSPRNCTPLGTGTYAITTLGDARVMTFANQPAAFARTNFERVFVERGGKVYFGYRNPVGLATPQVRLNLPAANAMLAQLGLPILTPTDAPQALTGARAANAATMKGVWTFTDAVGTGVLRVGDNGAYVSAGNDSPLDARRPGFEWGWLEVDGSGKLSRQLTLDTDGDGGLSNFPTATATVNLSETALTLTNNGVTEGFDGRLTDNGTGIVGMWAIGSPTDLRVTQFVFFANGKVLSIHPAETSGSCAISRQGPPGIEWSDYTFTAGTGALRFFNKVYDTSGCTGAFDSADAVPNTETTIVLTMAADQKTFTFAGDGGETLTAYRIAVNP
jgi:hypothetical protein